MPSSPGAAFNSAALHDRVRTLSSDADASDWPPALLLAVQSDRGLVGLRLPGPVSAPGRSRRGARASFTVLPSSLLVDGLSKIPPLVAALDWVKANRPAAMLYSDSLQRHCVLLLARGR